ncbi:MAG: hypothetical protein L0H26_08865, partial [Microlunatus sp.]|nr:hypothetical protein [Microlunatus sp.]
ETDTAGGAGVLITGSVVLVGEARTLLVIDRSAEEDPEADNSPVDGRQLLDADPDDDWSPAGSVDQTEVIDEFLTGESLEGEAPAPDPFDDDDPFADNGFADNGFDDNGFDDSGDTDVDPGERDHDR